MSRTRQIGLQNGAWPMLSERRMLRSRQAGAGGSDLRSSLKSPKIEDVAPFFPGAESSWDEVKQRLRER